MKQALLGALLCLSCAHLPPVVPNGACKKVEGRHVTDHGRPATICHCTEYGYDKKGHPVVRLQHCLDVPKPDAAKPRAKCLTSCGMRADLTKADCDKLTDAAADSLRAYADEVAEFRPLHDACNALDGWSVRLVPHDEKRCGQYDAAFWDEGSKACVRGLTRYTTSEIYVTDEGQWRNSALPHEIGHVLDQAFGVQGNAGHCGWERRGLFRVIQKVTGEKDGTQENCD